MCGFDMNMKWYYEREGIKGGRDMKPISIFLVQEMRLRGTVSHGREFQ